MSNLFIVDGTIELTSNETHVIPSDTFTMTCVLSHVAMVTGYELVMLAPGDDNVCIRKINGSEECVLENECLKKQEISPVCTEIPEQATMVLTITNVQEHLLGMWTCRYENPDVSASNSLYISQLGTLNMYRLYLTIILAIHPNRHTLS